MADYLVQEDGSSKFTLEDDSGFLLLEEVLSETPTPGGVYEGGAAPVPRVGVPPGGVSAGGTGASALVPISPGGVVVGGFEPFADVTGVTTYGRVSQLPVEVVVQPTDQLARVSQEPVEAVISPTSALARISQEPVEIVVQPTDQAARISQIPVEVIYRILHEQVSITIID